MADVGQTILIVNDGAAHTLRLNRPDVLNSFNAEMISQPDRALRDAEKGRSVRRLVVTGAWRAFSAGQDLAEVSERCKGGNPIELGARLRDG